MPSSELLADLVLLAHFAFVLFVVGGLPLTWLGRWRGWAWVSRRAFRITHLAAIGLVALQAVVGRVCPLTLLENHLRQRAGQGDLYERTFVEHWVGRLLFFDAEPWVFTVAYLAFLALVAATWWWVPVRRRGGSERQNPTSPTGP